MMEVVTVTPLGKKKSKICFNTDLKVALYNSEVRRFGIAPGCCLSRENYDEIVREVLLPRAKRRVLYLLQSMDRTEAQLRQKLKEGFFPEEVMDAAILYGKSYHYIDDERYARTYVNNKIKGKSRRMIAMELEQKGISREGITEAMEDISEEQELETVLSLIRRKRLRSEEDDKMVILKVKQYLYRKGFSFELIEKAMNQYLG